jgi:hypothetical protein
MLTSGARNRETRLALSTGHSGPLYGTRFKRTRPSRSSRAPSGTRDVLSQPRREATRTGGDPAAASPATRDPGG